MVHYNCERFHDNILNSFQHIEPTGVHGGNDYVQSSNGNNSKDNSNRVMVHKFCMPSHGALYLC